MTHVTKDLQRCTGHELPCGLKSNQREVAMIPLPLYNLRAFRNCPVGLDTISSADMLVVPESDIFSNQNCPGSLCLFFGFYCLVFFNLGKFYRESLYYVKDNCHFEIEFYWILLLFSQC